MMGHQPKPGTAPMPPAMRPLPSHPKALSDMGTPQVGQVLGAGPGAAPCSACCAAGCSGCRGATGRGECVVYFMEFGMGMTKCGCLMHNERGRTARSDARPTVDPCLPRRRRRHHSSPTHLLLRARCQADPALLRHLPTRCGGPSRKGRRSAQSQGRHGRGVSDNEAQGSLIAATELPRSTSCEQERLGGGGRRNRRPAGPAELVPPPPPSSWPGLYRPSCDPPSALRRHSLHLHAHRVRQRCLAPRTARPLSP